VRNEGRGEGTMQIEQNGEYMPISETGLIRRGFADSQFSGEWKLLGAVRFNNFGNIVETRNFDGSLLQLAWQYKNGKQRWHVMDLDHGTTRVWMNPRHRIVTD